MTYRRTTTLTVLRVVEEFHDDDTDEMPSLPGMSVYDTTADEVVTETRGPSLSKCCSLQRPRKVGAR